MAGAKRAERSSVGQSARQGQGNAEVVCGRLTDARNAAQVAPDDWLFVSYRSADAEAVTHITAPCAFFCVCVGLATAFGLPIPHVFVCGKPHMPGNGRVLCLVRNQAKEPPMNAHSVLAHLLHPGSNEAQAAAELLEVEQL